MTLVELLVVLGIIGMILAISVPGLSGYAKNLRLKTSTRQIVGLISLARSLAISTREDHAVVVDPEQQRVSVVNQVSGDTLEQMVRLPSSVTVEMVVGGEPAPEAALVFRPTGSLNGRTVTLTLADRDKRHTITVSGITGSVSVQ